MLQKINVDYHFHPNLPQNEYRAGDKVRQIYARFTEAGISAVIITEHVYKEYKRAWQMMKRFKPEHISIFPGLEYVTKENIDICIFAQTQKIYEYDFTPFAYTYEEIVSFVQSHCDLYSYVTHPFTLGCTSIIDAKGEEFTKRMTHRLGAAEASYTVYMTLESLLSYWPLSILFKNTLDRIKKNKILPQEFYPDPVKFFAGGSDAHTVSQIGSGLAVIQQDSEMFEAIVHNREIHPVGSAHDSIWSGIVSLAITLHEWWLKKLYLWYL